MTDRTGKKALSEEDRILWGRIAGSTIPLNKDRLPPPRPALAPSPEMSSPPSGPSGAPPEKKPAGAPARPSRSSPPNLHPFDGATRRRLGRGHIAIEASVDLHGMTQERAHRFLAGFLAEARRRGHRHIVVITGYGAGSGGEGVLRRAVPEWLSTPQFRAMVSGYGEADRRHGGRGALYVRLRRTDRPEKGS